MSDNIAPPPPKFLELNAESAISGYSPDALNERKQELFTLLRQVAPDLISDNQLDLNRLKDLIGEERIAPPEHYELNWAGKSAAKREVQRATSATLLPDEDNPAHAQHMLIEGENLEVLRVLQKSYHGRVKMIYIDPPYNTGNDSFVYPDDYSETLDEYQRRTGEKNEAGYLNKQSLWKKNTRESGQYHSVWLSMMYPRLYLARNLLREDGVIFASIDDNEVHNLRHIMDEVFGAENFVGTMIWSAGRKNDSRFISTSHEYMHCYIKNFQTIKNNGGAWKIRKQGLDEIYRQKKIIESKHSNYDDASKALKEWFKSLPDSSPSKRNSHYSKIDRRGIYFPDNISWPGGGGPRYEVIHPETHKPVKIPSRGWLFQQNQLNTHIADGRVEFGADESKVPTFKRYLHDTEYEAPYSVFYQDGRAASKRLRTLMGTKVFDFPKDETIIQTLIAIATTPNDIILDFFAGSGTTAHAVMALNVEDGGSRQSISVQLPEPLDENSEAYKAGYHTIADITRARIEKVIAMLKTKHPEQTKDLACANFTLAPSSFKVWRGDMPTKQDLVEQLEAFQQTEKPIHAADPQKAQLTELLLKYGFGALGVHAISKAKRLDCGVTVHRVMRPDDKSLWLCFDPYVDGLKDEIVKAKPAQIVLLNSCFVGSKADEQLSNLKLELASHDIDLQII